MNNSRRLFQLIVVIALQISGAAVSRAEPQELMLQELINVLAESGHSVIYSDSLVRPNQLLAVDAVDIPSLQKALSNLELQLVKKGEVWVIVRAESIVAPEPAIDPESFQGKKLLETVIVTGSLHQFQQTDSPGSKYSFSAAEMAIPPSMASDATKVTLRLPGVSSVGISSKPQIRGGLQDELLILQDNVELLEPFHLADYHSPYSSIDYHTIESLDFYTGGFPSRYGNRMSGVMDIRNSWIGQEYNTDLGVSNFSQYVNHRGELDTDRPGNWFVSLRSGDLSDLADYIESDSGNPEYLDGSLRIANWISENLSVSSGLTYAEDDITFEGEEEKASSKIKTLYGWSVVDAQISETASSSLTGSVLQFRRKKRQTSFEQEAKGGSLDHRQQVERLAIRNDWRLRKNSNLFEFGGQIQYDQADYDHTSRIDRGILADLFGGERLIERDIHLEPEGLSGGGYFQAQIPLGKRGELHPSMRVDFQDYYLERDADYQLSPRLGINYDFTSALSGTLNIGRFYQPEGIHELQVIDGVSTFYKPQHSDQILIGFKGQYTNLRVTIEAYHKRYKDPKGRFENVFNPFVLLPEMEPDRIGLTPDKAEATGVDFDLNWSIMESLNAALRYSYMDAEDRLAGEWVDRRWSQRHTFNGLLAWRGPTASVSLGLTWHTGWRSTVLPGFVASGDSVSPESIYNDTELREYLSIDISARKAWTIGNTRLELYTDVSNLTDRHNQAGIDFDVEEAAGGFTITPDQEVLLGQVVSVGAILSF